MHRTDRSFHESRQRDSSIFSKGTGERERRKAIPIAPPARQTACTGSLPRGRTLTVRNWRCWYWANRRSGPTAPPPANILCRVLVVQIPLAALCCWRKIERGTTRSPSNGDDEARSSGACVRRPVGARPCSQEGLSSHRTLFRSDPRSSAVADQQSHRRDPGTDRNRKCPPWGGWCPDPQRRRCRGGRGGRKLR
jgi:hypothetical protein